MNNNHTIIGGAMIAASILVVGGLVAVSGDDTTASPTPSYDTASGGDWPDTTTPDTTTPEPTQGNDMTFALAFANEVSPGLGETTDLTNDAVDDLNAYDMAGAAATIGQVADLYGAMADDARHLPGSGSAFGIQVIDVLDTCQQASAHSADALRRADLDAIGDTDQLDECSDGLRDIATTVEAMMS